MKNKKNILISIRQNLSYLLSYSIPMETRPIDSYTEQINRGAKILESQYQIIKREKSIIPMDDDIAVTPYEIISDEKTSELGGRSR